MSRAPGKEARKEIVGEFFELIAQGRQMEALRFFDASCRQHNPYVKGGMKELFDAMAEAQRQMATEESAGMKLEVRSVVAEGELVAAHTEICNRSMPEMGGLRQVHLFRFGPAGKVVEYWDVTQSIQPGMPHAGNAF